MFESQDLRASEWLPMGLGIVAFLLLGIALLMLLAAFRFPRFRSFAMWCIAVAIRPDRFEQGSVAHEIAWGLKRWFSGAVAPHGDAFEYLVPAGHLAIGQVGDEPLETRETLVADKKEAAVLRYLHRRAAGTPYGQYLPSIDGSSQAGPSAASAPDIYTAMRPWYSATQIRHQHVDGLAGQHVAWMFNRMLEILGYAHRQGIVHAAVLPQNLWFNTETHGLRLLDWTHAEKIGWPLSAVPQRYRPWYPADAYLVARPGLDIYMAANCAMFLAGRDIGCQQIPKTLPNPVGQFLRACLLESPRMRPQDAWELHRDARDLFATVFGRPEFHRLSMKY